MEKIEIKASDYFKICIRGDKLIELFIVDDDDLVEMFEGCLYIPE